MDQIVKVLGIAPYENMKSQMLRYAETHSNIELSVYVGDLETGADIASGYTLEDYDVILSRGGTAELIARNSPIPVIEIQLSAFDIFRVVKLAENSNEPYAIVGYPAIAKSADYLCTLLQYDIDIYTIHSPEEAHDTLLSLYTKGCRFVLCDVITSAQAQSLGMRSILFTSGSESIENAFEQAMKTVQAQKKLTQGNVFLSSLLEEIPCQIFAYSSSGRLIYRSAGADISDSAYETMQSHIPDILTGKDKTICKDEGTVLLSIRGVKKEIRSDFYVIYYVTERRTPLVLTKHGVRHIDKNTALEHFYASICGLLEPSLLFDAPVTYDNADNLPMILLGEDGTEQMLCAYYLYANSKFKNHPLVVVDGMKLNEKSWDFLMNHANSPFNSEHITLMMKSLDLLTDAQFQELIALIHDMNVYKRNQLIFAYTASPYESYPDRLKLLMNSFIYLPVQLRPLRENRSEIPNLINLYINHLNVKLAREVVGMEPEGVSLFESYDWPGNFRQFKRLMNELFSATRTPYILTDDVSRILIRETPALAEHSGGVSLDLDRTLDAIDLDIIRIVLAEENGNQSAAAKRLGISRTTLWRMLQPSKKTAK